MRKPFTPAILTLTAVLLLSGCGARSYPEPEQRVEVERTYEKVDPSPAVIADFYDMHLKLDTENDRLTETVSVDLQNNTDSVVDTVYIRYNPLGYFGYL